jgi:hypothetical protein
MKVLKIARRMYWKNMCAMPTNWITPFYYFFWRFSELHYYLNQSSSPCYIYGRWRDVGSSYWSCQYLKTLIIDWLVHAVWALLSEASGNRPLCKSYVKLKSHVLLLQFYRLCIRSEWRTGVFVVFQIFCMNQELKIIKPFYWEARLFWPSLDTHEDAVALVAFM